MRKKLVIGKTGLPLHHSMDTGRLAETPSRMREIIRQKNEKLFH